VPGVAEKIRGYADTAYMNAPVPSASVEVPERIKLAERWRIAGEILARFAPEEFEALFCALVMTYTRDDDDLPDGITKSYFLT
jgi:hypothetical protein